MRFFAALIASIFTASAASAEQVWVTMDQIRPYKLEKPATQILVGNPGIADITVVDSTKILLNGKTPGLTNVVFLDDNFNEIEHLKVRVRTASDQMLTVNRGAQRTTYNCTTQCEIAITVGDDTTVFTEAVQQTRLKFDQAIENGSQ
ncbi:MAG: pilus assembly protein N-terminal domain-containing protein [Pseudomonadota bacterium]